MNNDLQRNLLRWADEKTRQIAVKAEKQADLVEKDMQQSAIWQDQTGRARRNLNAKVLRDNNEVVIRIELDVPYGIYLENANERRYAIIEPTLRKFRKLPHTIARGVK
jgi:hypothetical protein